MQNSLTALTAKEKETLRLIVRGHDAKSAAQELDLSVHTINERLRNSRRKLGVTSSREAARLLLEDEANPPENLAYTPFGDANPAPTADHPPTTKRSKHAVIWIGGLAIMTIVTIAIVLSLSGLVGGQTGDARSTDAAVIALDVERDAAARDWLALVDQEDWQASYDAAGTAFQEPNTVESWRAASEQARGPLGPVLSREAIQFDTVASPQGYQIVRYRTDFENRAGAIESITLQREDGVLRVVGYFIS